MLLRKTALVLVLLWVVPQIGAQDKISASGSEELGWYVVRPGDTLRNIAARYLGSEARWERLWKLNSASVDDPDEISPEQKLRVPLPKELPSDGALLTKVSREVQDQPTPLEWNDSQENELLRARDGVKTKKSASAELRFGDNTSLVLTEQSIVFIGEQVRKQDVERQQIEVVVGQADLSGVRSNDSGGQFEIILGEATATPQADRDGVLETRARRPEKGGAQLMVYSGKSDLEAAGTKLEVGTGMGSSVAEGKAPSPPEKLLPAAQVLTPSSGSKVATPQPTFTWQPVVGAQSYTLEVCRDPECGILVERAVGLTESKWQPAGLPIASLYWRVAAVSPSGLDGYASGPTSFEVLTGAIDKTPPEIQIGVVGPQQAPRSGLNKAWIVGSGLEFKVEVDDQESGVESWVPHLDGKAIESSALQGPWERGAHTLAIVASDRAGNHQTREIPFIFDPDPPEFSWGIEGGGELGRIAAEPLEGFAAVQRGLRQLRIGGLDWELDSDRVQIRVRPQTRKPIPFADLGHFGSDEGLWIMARDGVCTGVDTLTYELVDRSERGRYVLHFEAKDCIGNTSRGSLPLVRGKGKKKN